MQHGPGMHMRSMEQKKVGYEIPLKEKRSIAEGTWEFTFSKPEGFQFRSGQHVRMTLLDLPEDQGQGRRRFLTIVSTPQEPDLVFAMRMSDSTFKKSLGQMEFGTKVLVEMLLESPHGSFALHEDATRPAVFLAGGIGIVPAYAMIKDALQRNLGHNLILFYSNLRPEDAAYLTELQTLAQTNKSFKMVATLTGPDQAALPGGEVGYIDRVMLEKHLENSGRSDYYISGLPAMVKSMQAVLKEQGVEESEIRSEEFAGFHQGPTGDESARPWRRHLLPMAGAVAILALVIGHLTGGLSLLHSDLFGSFSLTNPVSYGVIALVGAVVAVKVAFFSKVHSKRKDRS